MMTTPRNPKTNPDCPAKNHGTPSAAEYHSKKDRLSGRPLCVCPEAIERLKEKNRKRSAAVRARRAEKRKNWEKNLTPRGRPRHIPPPPKGDLFEHSHEVDWVVVVRTIEGDKNLITNYYELMDVIRELSDKGWQDYDIADLIQRAGHENADDLAKYEMLKITEASVSHLRKRHGLPKYNPHVDDHLMTTKEANRIVAQPTGKLRARPFINPEKRPRERIR